MVSISERISLMGSNLQQAAVRQQEWEESKAKEAKLERERQEERERALETRIGQAVDKKLDTKLDNITMLLQGLTAAQQPSAGAAGSAGQEPKTDPPL